MRHKFILAIIAAATALAGCNKEEKNTLPGLWLEEGIIATFPTDEVSAVGTASNYVGISTISLVCENWAVEHVYDLSSQEPEVFNFDYRFIVPETAEFSDDVMTVTVTDINGLQTSKEIVFEFLPDNEAPAAEPALSEQTSVEFDASSSTGGTWELDLDLYDRRGLGRAVISVPDAAINETVQIQGAMEYRLQKTYKISGGTYTATVTIYDLAGNRAIMETVLVVMPVEEEDPIEDYSQMFIVNAAEDPDDYLDGYYIHMDKTWVNGAEVPYTYQGEFYAPAGMELYIVPEESMEGDMFGVSPYVSSKLMNKKGYVKPVPVPGEGYYGLWIDIQNHQYSFWELEMPENICTEGLNLSGTGFTGVADWGWAAWAEPTEGTYTYTFTAPVNSGSVSYYFYTEGWARVFRSDANGYWWEEAAEGAAASFSSDYSGNAVFTLDTVLPYAAVKKNKTTE